MREAVDTGIPPTKSPLEWAVQADGKLYTALIATKPDGRQETGDISAQTTRTLDNLKQVLAAAGGSMDDVVQVLIYLTDGSDAAAMNAALSQPGHGGGRGTSDTGRQYRDRRPRPYRRAPIIKLN